MTTQAISDYLTKQIFIEKNIVTFRSLSRQFSIHVNAAKNELATYHHDAPYQSQSCSATFLISGTPSRNKPSNTQSSNPYAFDDDVDMEPSQATGHDEDEESDGEEVPQTKIVLVNEKDLEDANDTFDEIHSVHIYSLAPAPLKDAGLICIATENVRDTDKSKGPEFSVTVGRIVGKGIKPGKFKKRVLPPATPVAGPSKTKGTAAPETKADVKPETKEKEKTDKPKPTGKLDFFKKAEKPKDAKDAGKAKEVKNEPIADPKKKMFFSNPKPSAKAATKAPSPAPSESSAKEKEHETSREKEKEVPAPARGVKRKSSIGLEKEKEQTPKNANITSSKIDVDSSVRIKRKVVLSDDESDTLSSKPVRKTKKNIKVESTENSEAEREAMALMDIDDADVERVSRVPSTAPSTTDREGFEDDVPTAPEDEDVSMTDDASIKKPKTVTKRKPKAVIPVGRNGLKKRKVTKTRRTIDENGYTRKEDYSDWESVASSEEAEPPAPKTKAKGKAKSVVVKKEDDDEMPAASPAKEKAREKIKPLEPEKPEKSEKEKAEPPVKKAPAKSAAKLKQGGKEGVKKQTGLKNFFGPKKT